MTQAVRDSTGEVGRDPQGRLDRARAATASSRRPAPPADAVCQLLGKLVHDDSEIVTVLVGADAAANETDRIREHVEVTFPHLEIEFHDGGQPLYRYLVGVE